MNKDKLALAFALIIQFGAIVWWASRLDTSISFLKTEVVELKEAMKDVHANLHSIEQRLTRIEK